MPLADIGDGQIHYELRGEGPVLALLLPQSRGPVGLTPLLNSLAQHYQLLTYDQRGTGGSSARKTESSMTAQASDVIALLDSLEIKQASLLCHSTGCGIGISAAAYHPDRVQGLILASPWTHADWHLTMMQNLRMSLAHSLAPIPYATFNAALLYPPDHRRKNSAGFDKLIAEATQRPHDADQIRSRLEAILSFDARPLLAQITAPTLAVTARDDQLMPPWFAAEAASGIADAELAELDRGGHMLLETSTQEISDLVVKFLRERVT